MKPILRSVAALLAIVGMTACSSSLEQTALPATPPQAGAPQAGQAPSSASASDDASDSDSEGAPVSEGESSTSAPSRAPGAKPGSTAPAAQPSRLSAASTQRYVCRHPALAGRRECDAIVRADAGGARSSGYHGAALSRAFARAARSGACNRAVPYCASDLQAAYGLVQAAKTGGRGSTVAVVDAYGYPDAASDLAVYRKSMGLSACTATSGCLKIVNQSGQLSPLPRPNADPSDDWRAEEALDLDMVSAICPNCKILLIQTNSNKNADLAAGVNAAAARGAIAISNSYSGAEENASDAAYRHPGRAITASAGDGGVGASQPCSYAGVVCVGGTSLTAMSFGRGWSEQAWRLTGSGCSAYVAKPQWQHLKGCTMRSEADIAAVADPGTGVAIYLSGGGGWQQIGGTSVSAPLIAAIFALGPSVARANAPQWIWRHGGSPAYHDIVSGSNGECSISYLCHAREGYDGPTGWGTPGGISGF